MFLWICTSQNIPNSSYKTIFKYPYKANMNYWKVIVLESYRVVKKIVVGLGGCIYRLDHSLLL